MYYVDSDLEIDREELVNQLGTNIDRALDAEEEEEAEPKRAKGAEPSAPPPAQLGAPPPSPSLLLDPWFREQPSVVAAFVARVDRAPNMNRADRKVEARVTCRCGEACDSRHFGYHLYRHHLQELSGSVERAEQTVARSAMEAVDALLANAAATMGAQREALQQLVVQLQSEVAKLKAEVSRAGDAVRYFSAHATRSQLAMKALGGGRTYCATAELHQRLWDQGYFKDPLNKTVDELHRLTLKRIELGDKVKAGGAGLALTPTARALATLLYQKSSSSGYRLFRAVYRYPPPPREIRRNVVRPLAAPERPIASGGAFAAIGCHQAEWGAQAFRVFTAAGIDPSTAPFGLCWDPAKMRGEITWDARTGQAVGHLDFTTDLRPTSWQAMEDVLQHEVRDRPSRAASHRSLSLSRAPASSLRLVPSLLLIPSPLSRHTSLASQPLSLSLVPVSLALAQIASLSLNPPPSRTRRRPLSM